MKFAILILFLCLSTYIPRMLPALFMEKIQVSGKVNIFLQLIPYTAMASLIFPAILYVDKNIWIGIIASDRSFKKVTCNWCCFGKRDILCNILYAYAFIEMKNIYNHIVNSCKR